MDSQVLSLQQCGKATSVFVPSKDRDIVAQVGKCGSRGLDLIFPVLIQLTFLLLYEQVGTSTSRGFFFIFFFGFVQREASIWYHTRYDM